MADDNSTQIVNNPLITSSKEIDIDDHVAMIALGAKAIKTDAGEHGMSDDGLPKVLTTLETVKKSTTIDTEDDTDEIELCPYEDDDDVGDENAILLEVYNDDIDSTMKDIESTVDLENSIEMQQNGSSNKINHFSFSKIGSEISIKRVNEKPQKSNDLIAILEGDDADDDDNDNTEHYKVDMPTEPKKLTDEEAREIALQQMLNLPKKKKGRPRLNPEATAAAMRKKKQQTKNSENLVKDLMGDWTDEHEKNDELNETEFVVEFENNENGLTEINTIKTIPTETTFKRSRIVKKKVIWDPDAPETAIHYASYAHTSGPGKKINPTKTMRSSVSSETISDVDSTSPMSKRKKLSEIDKLLGDEGAANMLNSLNQTNNGNQNTKSSRSKTIKIETNESIDSNATISPKDTKDNSVQKKNATPTKIPKKRGPKKATASSTSWDYVYSSRPDDCMIIRRRSNSSYSSTTSLNRSSIDLPSAPPIYDDKESQFEFTKPNVPIKGEADMAEVFEEHKNVRGRKRKSRSNGFDSSCNDYKEITLTKCKTFTKLSINKKNGGILTIRLMKEIVNALQMLDTDDSCNLVLFIVDDNVFLNEIDTSSIHQVAQDKQKTAVIELCKIFRYIVCTILADLRQQKINYLLVFFLSSEFIHSIIDFKKVLILGLKGKIEGFGLALLLLFDIVIAQSNCTFGSFNNLNQQRIEGSSIILSTNKLNYNSVSLFCSKANFIFVFKYIVNSFFICRKSNCFISMKHLMPKKLKKTIL